MNNDYNYQNQPMYAQPTYAQPPMYGEQIVGELTEKAFAKGLAAAIMAWFPIASIIAIVFGKKALGFVVEARSIAAAQQKNAPGKLIPAKVLGMVGKIAGIVMTCVYALYALIYGGYLTAVILMIQSRT